MPFATLSAGCQSGELRSQRGNGIEDVADLRDGVDAVGEDVAGVVVLDRGHEVFDDVDQIGDARGDGIERGRNGRDLGVGEGEPHLREEGLRLRGRRRFGRQRPQELGELDGREIESACVAHGAASPFPSQARPSRTE
jgi:hypothetical protein